MDLTKIMKGRAEAYAASSADKFALTAVQKLCQHLGVQSPRSVKGSAPAWFRDNYPRFPVHLEVRKLKKCTINDMFGRMTKTEQWNEFIALLEELPNSSVGMIVQVTGLGLFIQHNAWHLSGAPGFTRLTRRAITADKGIVFESLESFAASVKDSGWTP